MNRVLLASALLTAATLSAATPANAAITPVNYSFSGAGSGTMTLNYDTATTVYTLNTLNLTLGTGTFNASNSALQEFGAPDYLLYGILNGTAVHADTTDFFAIFNPSLSSQTASTFAFANGTGFGAGDLIITRVASVPEPASWAMMLIGFGAIGFAIRRVKTAPKSPHFV